MLADIEVVLSPYIKRKPEASKPTLAAREPDRRRITRPESKLVVKSLDDRAQVRHGVNFDQLSDAEQKEILERYRVWGYAIDPDSNPDERQTASRLRANDAAFRFLRVALPIFVAAYWAVYFLVPAGPWREALTDSPVLIMWLAVFVINLPLVIEM